MNESGRGISGLALNKNNVGGLGGPGNWKSFESVEDCIDYMGNLLSKRYDMGYTTLEKLGRSGKYCARNEAPKWVRDNNSYISTFDKHYDPSDLMG